MSMWTNSCLANLSQSSGITLIFHGESQKTLLCKKRRGALNNLWSVLAERILMMHPWEYLGDTARCVAAETA